MSNIQDSRVAVLIDHNETKVFNLTDDPVKQSVIVRKDEYEINRLHLHQKASHFSGQRVPEDQTYYEAVADALKHAKNSLILSHGKGKSSAGLHLMKYLSKHHHDIADNVIGLEVLGSLPDEKVQQEACDLFDAYEHKKHLGL